MTEEQLIKEGYTAGPRIYVQVKLHCPESSHVEILNAMLTAPRSFIDYANKKRDEGLHKWCREQLNGSLEA